MLITPILYYQNFKPVKLKILDKLSNTFYFYSVLVYKTEKAGVNFYNVSLLIDDQEKKFPTETIIKVFTEDKVFDVCAASSLPSMIFEKSEMQCLAFDRNQQLTHEQTAKIIQSWQKTQKKLYNTPPPPQPTQN